MNFLIEMDNTLYQMIAGNGHSWPLAVWFGVFCAKVLIYMIPLHLIILWLCGGVVERRAALTIVISACIALVLSYLAGKFFFRPRPFMAGFGPALMEHRENPSFPSNHALIFTIYTFCLYTYGYKKIAKFALVAGILTCWGRVFVGVHYPFDMVGGFILGLVVSWGVVAFVMPYVPSFVYKILPLRTNKH